MTMTNIPTPKTTLGVLSQQPLTAIQQQANKAWSAAKPVVRSRAEAVLTLGLSTEPKTLLLIGAISLLAMGAVHLIVLLAGLLLFLLKGTAVVAAGLAVYQWMVAAGTRIDAVLTSVTAPEPVVAEPAETKKMPVASKKTAQQSTSKQSGTKKTSATKTAKKSAVKKTTQKATAKKSSSKTLPAAKGAASA
ncbi:MAG: hypothetical protein AAGE59_28365 [Cyanobacteria bacterium P01_F01_bin.86]